MSEERTDQEAEVDIRDKLNTETGKLEWHELERFFARGLVIRVGPGLDLIDVAAAIVEDDKAKVAPWTQQGLISPPSDEEVQTWVDKKPLFWAVVVAPWVVIQEISE